MDKRKQFKNLGVKSHELNDLGMRKGKKGNMFAVGCVIMLKKEALNAISGSVSKLTSLSCTVNLDC